MFSFGGDAGGDICDPIKGIKVPQRDETKLELLSKGDDEVEDDEDEDKERDEVEEDTEPFGSIELTVDFIVDGDKDDKETI